MQTLKYSRQREAIKHFLQGRTDHPTADTIYVTIKEEFPNISLGTVYRNLALLSDIGEIQKIPTAGAGSDRFDGNTKPHYHFICTKCNCVSDIHMPSLPYEEALKKANFKGQVKEHITYFYGLCEDCLQKE